MSLAALKLNPAIAKPTSNGQVHCIVCNTQIKPKVWLAHTNGRKHKESAQRLRQQLTSGPKRVAEMEPVSNGAPPSKKAREIENTQPSSLNGATSELPADFFDSASGSASELNIQTPWQKAKQDEKEMSRGERKGIIEGVPQGFFDDKRKDNMVREAVERNEQLDDEYDRLMREVNEQQTEEQTKADEEAESEARSRDIANIDDQLAEMQKLNELEKKKEELYKIQARNRRKRKEESSDDSDGDDGGMDFDNWRAKKIL